VVLLHDNARPHTATSTRALLADFAWDVFFHPPYSPDLAPCDFHLFTHLKQFLGGTHIGSDEEVKKIVKDWVKGLVADFYNAGIQKLVTQYGKCLNLHGDYIENLFKICSNDVK
jgi:transposase